MSDTFRCRDCHETRPILHNGGTGYATLRDGHRVCYACCAERDRRAMRRTGVATLYLLKVDGGHEVTNWPGTLRFCTLDYSRSRHSCWSYSPVYREDAHFIGPDGHIWHAVVRGDMQLARCKRTRRTA